MEPLSASLVLLPSKRGLSLARRRYTESTAGLLPVAQEFSGQSVNAWGQSVLKLE